MGNYDDIINLPHHVSAKHPRMSMLGRAAQFSPFAALTGYEKAIEEARKKQEEIVRNRNAPVDEVTYRICAAAHPASHRGGALGR
mgnify:FL=1